MIVQVHGNEFIIKYFDEGNHKKHIVFWDGRKALCSCKNFEFWGILCRHIFRVLNHKDCFKIPPEYLPLRWCRNLLQSGGVFQNVSQEETFMDDQLEGGDILCPPKSVTKGRPKKRRLMGGKELANKTIKTCSICKESGHTKPTCSNKENNMVLGTRSSNLSGKKCLASDIGLNPIFTLKY
uniref:protein FAR1-RELATED SEQUENCE 5-like n=1 Tax=Erigeron canadensis TaxID=72917 RepID=UPI001CB91402|nr:protein FAR1-RELATED SEQUENCE 5-like [Erigeron canadensis]